VRQGPKVRPHEPAPWTRTEEPLPHVSERTRCANGCELATLLHISISHLAIHAITSTAHAQSKRQTSQTAPERSRVAKNGRSRGLEARLRHFSGSFRGKENIGILVANRARVPKLNRTADPSVQENLPLSSVRP